MKETELAQHFIDYFAGCEIYPEVPYGGIIDFIAVMGIIRTAVEVKVNFNFKVFEQAVRNTRCCNYSYIAVPYTRDDHFRKDLCRKYGVGLLYFVKNPFSGEAGSVMEIVAPVLHRKIEAVKLEEYMKQSVAGSQNDRVTAFGNTVNTVTQYLQRNTTKSPTGYGSAPIAEVLKQVKHHYGTNSSAKRCIAEMCRAGVIKDFTFEKGILKLTEKTNPKNPNFKPCL